MKLYEYQAKQVFASFGLPVPKGEAADTPDKVAEVAERIGGRVVIKAQVHVGGRGKAGGVKLADDAKQAREIAQQMLGMNLKGFVVKSVLVEQALPIDKEYYLSFTLDRDAQHIIGICSAMGGVDIEEVAESHPDKIIRMPVDIAFGPLDFQIRDFIREAGLEPTKSREIGAVMKRLYEVYVQTDASLAEINPLVVTKDGQVIVADAKFDVDDNALFRQKELAKYADASEEDELEAEAHRRGLTYVHLGGEIGTIGNGAGLCMNTLDIVNQAGGKAANFLDIGGGARADVVRNALDMVLLDPAVKAILINIFGGITRGDEVAKGVLEATSTLDVRVPIVVRMAGTEAESGLKLLEGSKLIPAATAPEAAKKAVELSKAAA
ncbi:MAG TPA: ADP-forming succinate--CoA ligase subunit beta [Chloroflexota bacterium]|nr:ADP-forming succinate--CoA ligase subunit beta [Chloroflexota bacterium]